MIASTIHKLGVPQEVGFLTCKRLAGPKTGSRSLLVKMDRISAFCVWTCLWVRDGASGFEQEGGPDPRAGWIVHEFASARQETTNV